MHTADAQGMYITQNSDRVWHAFPIGFSQRPVISLCQGAYNGTENIAAEGLTASGFYLQAQSGERSGGLYSIIVGR